MAQKNILVAPLNWGLGHATRCIPLIRELQRQGATVILAADGAALDLLQREFPDLESHALPAYNIRYPFKSMVLSMALQMPKILRGCLGEYFWLKKFLKTRAVDAVISDNRFGFFSRQVRSVFITHQVQILVPNRFLQRVVNWVNHFFIRRFDACWIPDFEHPKQNLAGDLAHFDANIVGVTSSHTDNKKLKIKYLGALSRMKNYPIEKKYDLAFVLSGPEPQRSFLEVKIWDEMIIWAENELALQIPSQVLGQSTPSVKKLKILFVRGAKPQLNPSAKRSTIGRIVQYDKYLDVELHDLLSSDILNQKMLESQLIICRSGYSSLMDLWQLGVPAVLIPTDGQTEQEYLAEKLHREGRFFSQKQRGFSLKTALDNAPNHRGFSDFPKENETLRQIVHEFLIF
jgi:hypothetical protein